MLVRIKNNRFIEVYTCIGASNIVITTPAISPIRILKANLLFSDGKMELKNPNRQITMENVAI